MPTLNQDPLVKCRHCGHTLGAIVHSLFVQRYGGGGVSATLDANLSIVCKHCQAIWRPPPFEDAAKVETLVRRAIERERVTA